MKRLYKLTAVTLVTAFIFITMCIPSYAATEYGVYGQGGFDPPFGWEYIRDNEIIFLPLDVNSNGEYVGHYFLIPRMFEGYGRIIFTDDENNSAGKYGYYLQLGKFNSEGYCEKTSAQRPWRTSSYSLVDVNPTWTEIDGLYYACYFICYSDNCYFDSDSNYHTYVLDSESDLLSVMRNGTYKVGPGHGGYYNVFYPLLSTDVGWAENYGYETLEEEQEAIEQSRYDEQNKIMKEGFTVLENSINNMGNRIEGAITQAVDDILNAGSDMPSLDTNNDWMNDSLTKVNEWVSSLEAFEEQMNAAEEENAENMAHAKTFLSSFFSKIPKGIIAVLTLALVMIVVVKAVGR